MTELTDLEIAARIRAGRRCPIDGEDRRPGGLLCWEHHDELGRMLDPGYRGQRQLERAASIPQLWARLDLRLVRSGAGRRAPGFHGSPPLSLDAVVLRDRRSKSRPVVDVWYELAPDGMRENYDRPYFEDVAPARSVQRSVERLADTVWDALDYGPFWARLGLPGPPPTRAVVDHCAWLHAHLDHLTACDDAVGIFHDVAELHGQLRVAAGDPRERSVADCTGWVRDRDSGEKVACGAPLYMPLPDPGVETGPARPREVDGRKPVIRCGRCDRPYSTFMLLRQQIGQERKAG